MKAKAFLIILIIGLFSWNYFYQLSADQTLTHCIIDQIISQQSIDFAKIENLDADHILIIAPYAQINILQSKLKMDLRNIRNNGIRHLDHFNLVVFIKNGKSVSIAELSRKYGDFKETQIIIPTAQAKLKKVKAVWQIIL
ncbi:hypothetical protein H9N25_04610 [Pedobacter riviphilus]|uniref:Uncharacterized protein n=1 Tax=Pedobacter riviphilus TaxID=2766984 RepID=A0ABX6TJQ0_9SPHI|nr:hypothetical protein [Pedobacter riviphilus]QNR85747.1 hypothetical protein H9N25_04610 [Pedobacter riviphilus]